MSRFADKVSDEGDVPMVLAGQKTGCKRVLMRLITKTECDHADGEDQCDRCLLLYDIERLSDRTDRVFREYWRKSNGQ